MTYPSYRVLAISGSLRARSTNTEALRAAAFVAPASLRVEMYPGLASLPHFNPDLDVEGAVAPNSVERLRAQVGVADALLISSPEYAHGVPGALKNALDWLVSSPVMVGKRVGLLNISPRSTYVSASLAETLRTMSAVIVPGAWIELPITGTGLDAVGIAAHPEFATKLRSALETLVERTRAQRAPGGGLGGGVGGGGGGGGLHSISGAS